MDQRSNRERRSAATSTGRVRILEREAGLLKVALVIDYGAVQVLRAELVDEEAHTGAFHHDVVRRRLLLNVQAVPEAGTATRQHGDTQAGRLLRHLLLSQELLDFLARPLSERKGYGG